MLKSFIWTLPFIWKFLEICSHSRMKAAILLLDVNSWLLWLIPHHHSGYWAEDFVRIRTPTGSNNGSAEWRRGKRRGGSPKCKFNLSSSLHRETLQECPDLRCSPNGKWKSENTAREDGDRCAVAGSTCRRPLTQVGFRFILVHLFSVIKPEEGKLYWQRWSPSLRPVKSHAWGKRPLILKLLRNNH